MADRVLTAKSDVRCDHETGVVNLPEKQDLVWMTTRAGVSRVLVDPTLNGTAITGCLWAFTQGQQCKTAAPLGPAVGRSSLLFVNGRPVVLDNVRGGTNSNPPAAYTSKNPKQDFVFSTD